MIQTLYFPAIEPDTLNGSPVQRSFYMISCYDQDTNGDGYITNTSNKQFSANGVSEISEFENLATGSSLIVPWTGINALEAEPSGDPGAAGPGGEHKHFTEPQR